MTANGEAMEKQRGLQRFNLSYTTFESIFDALYRCLAVGFLVALGNLPILIFTQVVIGPLDFWPILFGLGITVGPSLCAGFWSFTQCQVTGESKPVRFFLAGYRTTWRQALGIWVPTVGLFMFLFVDVLAVWGTQFAVLLGPLFAVLGLLGLATSLIAMVAVAQPDHELTVVATLKLSLLLAVRKFPLTLVSLILVAVWVTISLARPVIGLFLISGFVLYALWSNGRGTLASLTGTQA